MSEQTIFFSIIVPSYQVEAYLEECLESILSQKFKNFEVILIDDGSTDSTGRICDEYQEKYACVKVVHQENRGLSGARNTGIEYASGEYFIFVDSDDKIAENALESLHDFIVVQNNVADVVVTRRMTINPVTQELEECRYHFDIERFAQMDLEAIYEEVDTYEDCWLGAWIFCVRGDYIRSNSLLFYEGLLHEDEEWVPRILFQAQNVCFANIVLYCYRVERTGSITAVPNIKRLHDRIFIADHLGNIFQDKKYDKKVQECIRYRRQKILFGVLCDLCLYKENTEIVKLKGTLQQRMELLKKSKKRAHRYAYCLSKVVGIMNVSCILNWIKKL